MMRRSVRRSLSGNAINNKKKHGSPTPTPSEAPPEAVAAGLVTLNWSLEGDALPAIRAETLSSTGEIADFYWYGYPGQVSMHSDGSQSTMVSNTWSGDVMHAVSDGVLSLKGDARANGAAGASNAAKYDQALWGLGSVLQTGPNYNDIIAGPPYTSGKQFPPPFCVEALVKCPANGYYWPGVWLFFDDYSTSAQKVEIDIMEAQSAQQDRLFQSYHTHVWPGGPAHFTEDVLLSDVGLAGTISGQFIRVSCVVTATHVYLYTNGVQTVSYAHGGAYNCPWWLVLTNGPGNWDNGTKPSVVPDYFLIDRVRVWL